LLLEADDGHHHLIVSGVEPLRKSVVRRSLRALDEAQRIRIKNNHERLEARRCDLRYARPNFKISSKAGSSANRPA